MPPASFGSPGIPPALRSRTQSGRILVGLPENQSPGERSGLRPSHLGPPSTPRCPLGATSARSAARVSPTYRPFFTPHIGHYLCMDQYLTGIRAPFNNQLGGALIDDANQ